MENFERLEGSRIEFKEDIPKESLKYLKTVVAFANCAGGDIYFGVDDNGKIKGFSDEEAHYKEEQVLNAIATSCEPKIIPRAECMQGKGKTIIRISIDQGSRPPYYIRRLGKEEGIFQRISNETRVAQSGSTFVKELELKGNGFEFDTMQTEGLISLKDINSLCSRLYRRAKENEGAGELKRISRGQLISWGVVKEFNRQYFPTNAWWLFTDPSKQFKDYAVIKMAVFKGINRDIFLTRKIVEGPIDIQLEEALSFVLEHINLSSRFIGSQRIDYYELPVVSIREMIANALCHRSYMSPAPITLSLFDDKLEINSPGSLHPDLSWEQLREGGFSYPRNRAVAHVFHYLNLIEAWGTGIERIYDKAKDYRLREPKLELRGNGFSITLYRRKPEFDEAGVLPPSHYLKSPDLREKQAIDRQLSGDLREKQAIDRQLSGDLREKQTKELLTKVQISANYKLTKPTLEKLEQIAKSNMEYIRAKSVRELLGCADSAARRLITLLKGAGVIEPISGHGKGTYKWLD
ncbi:MAG: putative DNA binding domain-containing protein [Aeriscardovia sp.]|nr:putative DNA binding domain-containing protein [Aeriscardovia sp.]